MTDHLTLDQRLNDFAFRCFRDNADGDYIAARFACRAALLPQYLWASQQAIEKYLKCILLLHRIEAQDVRHDLAKALKLIARAGRPTLDLCERTKEFIKYLDGKGRFRYLEVSQWGQGTDLVTLDRAVWEVRQHCILRKNGVPPHKLIEGVIPPKVRLAGGYLERVIDAKAGNAGSARAALLWQNVFFGRRNRRFVKVGGWLTATNAPLSQAPEIFKEVSKYVFLPKDVQQAYIDHAKRLARKRSR